MATRNQPSTRFREEIGIVSPWVFFFAALAFVSVFVLLMCFIGRDHNPPPVAVRPLLGLIAGTVISCYIVLISYVNKDAGRRGMSRTLWTLIAIFVPNGLGIVLYFVLRKPRTATVRNARPWSNPASASASLPYPLAARLPALAGRSSTEWRRQILPLLRRSRGSRCRRAVPQTRLPATARYAQRFGAPRSSRQGIAVLETWKFHRSLGFRLCGSERIHSRTSYSSLNFSVRHFAAPPAFHKLRHGVVRTGVNPACRIRAGGHLLPACDDYAARLSTLTNQKRGCPTSRAFREVGRRAADTGVLPMLPHAVFPLLPSDHQSRRPIHAMHSLVVHMLSRAAQQNMQPPIPEAWFSRQLHQLRAQRLIAALAPIAITRHRHPDQPANPAAGGRHFRAYNVLLFES